MFKNIIAPIQAWLLSQGKCVACGTDLKNGKKVAKGQSQEEVTCRKCNRIFLYNLKTKRYQRAPLPQNK